MRHHSRSRHAAASARRRPGLLRVPDAASDVVLTLALDALTALPLLHHRETSPAVWLLDQALVLPLLLRRRHPVPVFVVLVFVAAVQGLLGPPLPADASLLVALYTLAAHQPRAHAVRAAVLLEAAVVAAAFRFEPTGDGIAGSLVFLTGLVAAAYLWGTSQRTRREYLLSVEDRAVRLERERDQQVRLSAIAERTRIAREMHDIVAHNLSVMITLAEGAAATNTRGADTATEAMTQVAGTGRQALAEMRQLLGVLRDEDEAPGLDPLPGLNQLDALIQQVRSTGLTVKHSVRGQPMPLTASAELAIYRAVQEALTNTLKHAPEATTVHIQMNWFPGALEVNVTDDGAVAPPERPGSTTGTVPETPARFGLSGMGERLAVHGGTLTAEPVQTRGWVVRVWLPLDRPENLR